MMRKIVGVVFMIVFLVAFAVLTITLVAPVRAQKSAMDEWKREQLAAGWWIDLDGWWHHPFRSMIVVAQRSGPLELSTDVLEELVSQAYSSDLQDGDVSPDERDCWNGDLNALSFQYPKLLQPCSDLGVHCLSRRTLWLLHYEQGQQGAISPDMDAIFRKYLRLNPARIEYEE